MWHKSNVNATSDLFFTRVPLEVGKHLWTGCAFLPFVLFLYGAIPYTDYEMKWKDKHLKSGIIKPKTAVKLWFM